MYNDMSTQELIKWKADLEKKIAKLESDYGLDSLSDSDFEELGMDIADIGGIIEEIDKVLESRTTTD